MDTGFLCLNWGVLVLFGTQPFSKLRRYSQAAVGTVRIPVEAFRPPADPAVIQPLYRARFDRNHKLRYALARGAHLVRMQTVVLELNVTTLASDPLQPARARCILSIVDWDASIQLP